MLRQASEDEGLQHHLEDMDEASDSSEYHVPQMVGIRMGQSSQTLVSRKWRWLISRPWTRWIVLTLGLFMAFMAGRMSSQPSYRVVSGTEPRKEPSASIAANPIDEGFMSLGPEMSAVVNEQPPIQSSPALELKTASPLPFRIVISVMAYNRPSALKRALESLVKARYGQQGRNKQVPLYISVDHYPVNPTSTMIRRSHIGGGGGADGGGGGSKEVWLKKAHKTYLQVLQIAETFQWPYGEKIINVRTVNGGTQGAWLQAWYPSNDDEYCFFMEDDLVVSPNYFEYLSFMVAQYAYGIPPKTIVQHVIGEESSNSEMTKSILNAIRSSEESHMKAIRRISVEPYRNRLGKDANLVFPYSELRDSVDSVSAQNSKTSALRLFGISLQRQYLVPGLNSQVKTPIPHRSTDSSQSVSSLGEAIFIPGDHRMPHPFLYQEVGTWGQLMFPNPWREFVQYYERVKSQGMIPALPGTIAEQWVREVGSNSMWTPYHQRWAFETQSFTIYANLPFGLALSDSMRDRGVTTTKDLGPSARLARGGDLMGEGQNGKCKMESECTPGVYAWVLPSLPLLERYDMCFRRVPHGKEPSTTLPIDCSKDVYKN